MPGTSRLDPSLARYMPFAHSHLAGVYRVLSALEDAVTVVHGPVGCHWQASSLESLANPDLVRSTFSALKEISIVYGGKSKLMKVLEITKQYHKGKHLFVITTPATEIVGDDLSDLESTATIVSGVSLSGDVGEGMEYAYSVLAKFVDPRGQPGSGKPRVNIIGWQWDVVHSYEDAGELLYLLNNIVGVEVNSVVPRSLDDVRRMCHADISLVFGYGESLARKAEKLCGVPYRIVPFPYGLEGTISVLEALADTLGSGLDESRVKKLEEHVMMRLRRYRDYLSVLIDMPVIVVGDPARLAFMTRLLTEELGMDLELAYANYGCRHSFNIPKLRLDYESVVEKLNNGVAVLGTDIEYALRNNTIVFSYPGAHRVSFEPYMGRGLVNVFSDIVNTYLLRT